MITEKHNGHTLVLFDSIEDLPIERFQAFNFALLLDSGIGGDVESINSHIAMMAKLIESDKKAEAMQQLANYQQSLHFIVSGVNPKLNAFAPLLYSIDGELVTDFSESGVKAISEKLSKRKFTLGIVGRILDTLKKKLLSELSTCFPTLSGSGKETEYYSKLKNKITFQLRKIQGFEVDKQLKVIDDYLLRMAMPKNFAGINGLEIKQKKEFQQACALISQHMNISEPQKLTVFGFYSRLEILKKQLKPKN